MVEKLAILKLITKCSSSNSMISFNTHLKGTLIEGSKMSHVKSKCVLAGRCWCLRSLFAKRLVCFPSLFCVFLSVYVQYKQPSRMPGESIFYISLAGNKPQNGVSRPDISSQFPSMGERLLYGPYPLYYALFSSGGRRISFVLFSPLQFFLQISTFLFPSCFCISAALYWTAPK